MKKTIRFFMVMLLAFTVQAFFVSCGASVGSGGSATYYTITYHKNYDGATAPTYWLKYKEGETASFRSESRKGHEFLGWAKTADAVTPEYKAGDSVKVSSNLHFYAVWLEQSKSIKITYNKNDGTATPEETSYYVEKGKSFTLRANTFTRDGMSFAGWSKSKSSKKKEYADKAEIWSFYADSDITLYALWHDDAHYVITYYSNFEGSTYDYKEQTLEKSGNGTTANLVKNTFERTGYVFYGWYTSSSLPQDYYGTVSHFYTDEAKIALTKDANLYACWLEDKSSKAVKLTFNKNDGTAMPEETSY